MCPPKEPWPIFITCSLRETGTTSCKNDCPSIFARWYNIPSLTTKPPLPRSANFQQPVRDLSLRCSWITSSDLHHSFKNIIHLSFIIRRTWFTTTCIASATNRHTADWFIRQRNLSIATERVVRYTGFMVTAWNMKLGSIIIRTTRLSYLTSFCAQVKR